MVEVLAHYSKRARHYLQKFDAVQAALESQVADTANTVPSTRKLNRQRYRLVDRLGSDVLDQIVARYEAGEPTTTLSGEFGIAKSSLLRLIRERGVAMRHQSLTEDQERRMTQLRREGMSIRAIAAQVSCGYGTAQTFFRKGPDAHHTRDRAGS